MTHNASRTSSERPLLGAVLCCTSIAPEERTRIADYAEQMGAEHKLDLTSDVTHLLVGSTNTPKYQYVAREREDVKVLRPEWVGAVRECWMEDRVLDLNAMEAEYRVPTLAGLKICITGFDDLNHRAHLQKSVIANGGEYTGDLTKDVTHLIALQPEGKKYEYATLWQKKVVSIQWYKDTLSRGMQLDESSYHPSRPTDEQGKGAWNRQDTTQAKLGKRPKDEQPPQEPARKLRRTASAKLSSQTHNMWDDIVGNAAPQENAHRDVLRPSKSMPLVRQESQANKSLGIDQGPSNDNAVTRDGFLSCKCFAITNFDKKKEVLIDRTLRGANATVFDTVTGLITDAEIEPENMYLIVPHQLRTGELPYFGKSPIKPTIVTELWLERCMLAKSYIPVEQYPLGGLIAEITSPEIESFEVNATGFQSIETLHIAKTVALTGAKYSEVFTPLSKVLVCNSRNINKQKLFHAREWGVPAVSEKWLCDFLTSGQVPKFSCFPVPGGEDESVDLETVLNQKRLAQSKPSRQLLTKDEPAPVAHKSSGSGKGLTNKTNPANSDENHSEPPKMSGVGAASTSDSNTALTEAALREISPNSPNKKSVHSQSHMKKTLFNKYDGPAILQENRPTESQQPLSNVSQSKTSPLKMANDATSINTAIQDLLNMKARAKKEAAQREGEPKEKRKKLLGRALSNLSNASHGSIHSRASSVDSLNTDGIGSEIAPASARSNNADTPTASIGTATAAAQDHRINSLSSRALQSRSNSSAIQPSSSTYNTAPIAAAPATAVTQGIDPSDPLLLRDEFAAADEGPQLTQLGYEDSAEAVALRERLAEKRRARSRLGQEESDPKPEISRGKDRDRGQESRTTAVTKQQQQQQQHPPAQKKVIRDDDTLNASGWGGGRRTRGAKNRSRDLDTDDWIVI